MPTSTLILALVAVVLVLVCGLAALWDGRRRYRRLVEELRGRLDRQTAATARALAATIAIPPPPPAAQLRPGAGRRAHTAISVLDAADLLLITRYVQQRAEAGSALHEAAGRVRMIGETAAADLGIHVHLRGRGRTS
ncbi:MAG TPA: hypothetical protein VG276_28175 [Actinomycetes bacterium]|jgi:hypothetical protein|nr:hypothetical protein [Actinomycetes bacterium]